MNLPNKLTLFRIFLIPIIIFVYASSSARTTATIYSSLSVANLIILLLVVVGAITDMLDGKIARKRNLITNFGKFLDPVADKLLIITVFVILTDQTMYYQKLVGLNSSGADQYPSLFTWWMLAIILAREFIVTGLRLVAVGEKKVIAASKYGKIKTTLQFATAIFLLAGCAITQDASGNFSTISLFYEITAKLLLWAMIVITIFSGADYIIKNKEIFLTDIGKGQKPKREKKQKGPKA